MGELTPLALLSAVLLPWLIGFYLADCLGLSLRREPLACAAWAYPLGAALVGGVTLVWLHLPLALDARTLAPGAVLVAAGVGLGLRSARAARAPAPRGREAGGGLARLETGFFAAVVLAVVTLTLYRIVTSTLEPIYLGDQANHFGLKAKLLFANGGFDSGFGELARRTYRMTHPDYPLLSPLLHLWTYAHAGGIAHAATRVGPQSFALASVLLAASALHRWVRPGVGALLLLALVDTDWMRVHTTTAYADVAVAWAFAAAAVAWLRWRDGECYAASLGACALGLLVAFKNEGLLYLAAILATRLGVALVERWRRGGRGSLGADPSERTGVDAARSGGARRVVWLLPAAFVVGFHVVLNRYYGFDNDLILGQSSAGASATEPFWSIAFQRFGERGGAVTELFLNSILLNSGETHYLLAGVLVFLALGALWAPNSAVARHARIPGLTLVWVLLGFAVVFLGTPKDLQWHAGTSAARVAGQTLPLATILLGVLGAPRRRVPR